jgi:membrane protein implicated in regulation of membrane protease activity
LRVLFLVAFIGGLVLAVFAMLHGLEHLRPRRKRAPSPFLNLSNVAAFAVGFGATGYPLATRTQLPTWGLVLLGLAGGGVAVSGMTILLAQWALRGGTSLSPEAEAEEVQGLFAQVTTDIPAVGRGRITYDRLGKRLECDAQCLSNGPLPRGTEVVIDRIDDGVAYVEEWSVVEQRL